MGSSEKWEKWERASGRVWIFLCIGMGCVEKARVGGICCLEGKD